MSISENLQNCMKNKGLKPADLSKLSGVPVSRISEIVTGKTLNPQMKTLVKLAVAMEVSIGEIARDSGVETTNQSKQIAQFIPPGYESETDILLRSYIAKTKGKTAEERMDVIEGMLDALRESVKPR